MELTDAVREACLRSHGLRVCPTHGVSSCVNKGYRHLISDNASGEEIERKVQKYCRQKKSGAAIESKLPNIFIAKEVGRAVANLRSGASSGVASGTWCSVENKTQLLYFCGCKHVQPMRCDKFREHMRAEGNKHNCKLSVWGKSRFEQLILEANAFAFCGVRCSRATCGRWVVRSQVEPDMAKLSYYLQNIKAPSASRLVQQSESISTGVASSAIVEHSAGSNGEDNKQTLQPAAMEVEKSVEIEDRVDIEAPAESARVDVEGDAELGPTSTNAEEKKESARKKPRRVLDGANESAEKKHKHHRTASDLLDE